MLDATTTIADALNDSDTKQFTRIPVFGDDADNILGFVIRADLYEAERQGKGTESIQSIVIRSLPFPKKCRCIIC